MPRGRNENDEYEFTGQDSNLRPPQLRGLYQLSYLQTPGDFFIEHSRDSALSHPEGLEPSKQVDATSDTIFASTESAHSVSSMPQMSTHDSDRNGRIVHAEGIGDPQAQNHT